VTSSWKPLRSAVSSSSDPAGLVLGVDFPATSRREAGFADLAEFLTPSVGLWQTAPGPIPPGGPLTGADYLAPWLAEVTSSGHPVRAVLGYCVGAVHAAVLAERIAQTQDVAPEIVIFDPELSNITTLRRHFGKVLANLSAVLDADELDAARAEAEAMASSGVTEYAVALFELFGRLSATAFERAGLEPDFGAEIVGMFGGYLTFLSIAEQLDPRDGWQRAIVISSASLTSGLNRLRADGALVDQISREIRFDVEHHDLLRTPGVGEAVNKLLELP
jgi:hypothetical protein